MMLLIAYDSVSGNTERMAKLIAKGAAERCPDILVKKIGEVIEKDLEEAEVIVLGCPTYNRDMTADMKTFLRSKFAKMRDTMRGKMGAAFGAYGWSGEARSLIKERMKQFEITVLDLHQDFTGTPDENFYITSLSDIERGCLKFADELVEKSRQPRQL
jgi:flavorubredoxin